MGFWRTEDPVLGELNEAGVRPILVGGMWKHQREWHSLPNKVKLLVGGYGSGKTRQLCKWCIAGALHNAPAWSAIVSPNFPLARRTVIPTLVELLEGKASIRPDFTWSWDKGDHAFNLFIEGRPPARLLYLSGDNPDNLKGPNLGTAGIDEPFIQDRAVFEQMYARLRDPRARTFALGLTGTPEQLNWGYDIAEGEQRGRYDLGVVHADTRDNLALPKSYSEDLLKAYDEKMAEAYIKGQFVSLSTGRVFYSFDRHKNVADIAPEAPTWFIGMDFNVNPMACIVGWHKNGRAHIVKEYEFPNADTQYACSVIKEEFPQIRFVYPDPSGKSRHTNAPGGVSDFTWIQRAGMIVLAPNDAWPRRDSFNAVNAKFHKGELTVSTGCKRLIRYLSEHTHELAKKQESMTHLLDAMRYPITYLYPIHRPSTSVTPMSA